jgi:cell division protein ZapA
MSSGPLSVKIYGETYPLKAGGDAEYAAAVARYVDDKMHEVAASGKVIPTTKIAVLAALNIADELFRLRRAGDPAAAERQIARLTEELARSLDEAGAEP